MAYNNKGYLYIYLHKYDEAVDSLAKALAIDGTDRPTRLSMALALQKRNRGDDTRKAREMLDLVLKENGRDLEAIYAYAQLGKKDEFIGLAKGMAGSDPELKERLKTDMEFEPYRNDPEFKAITR